MMRSWLSRWSEEHHEDEAQEEAEADLYRNSRLRDPTERGRQRRRLAIRLDLDLAPDELAAGQAVVRYMYSQTLDGVEDDWELLNCMLLADRWLLPDCAAQCAARLQSTPAGSLSWRVRAALLALPPGLAAASPQVAQLQSRAEAALMRTFRCPELMWEDPDNRQLLLSLPADRLAQLLLARDDLQVTSENVVLALLSSWLQHHLPYEELLRPAHSGDEGGDGGAADNGSGATGSGNGLVQAQTMAGGEKLEILEDDFCVEELERRRFTARAHLHLHQGLGFGGRGSGSGAQAHHQQHAEGGGTGLLDAPGLPAAAGRGLPAAANGLEAPAVEYGAEVMASLAVAAPPEVEALLRLVRYGNLTPHYRTAVVPLLPGLRHLRLHHELLAEVNAAAAAVAAAATAAAAAAEAQAAAAAEAQAAEVLAAAATAAAAAEVGTTEAAAAATAFVADSGRQCPSSATTSSASPSTAASPCPTRTSSCCLDASCQGFTPEDMAADDKLAVRQPYGKRRGDNTGQQCGAGAGASSSAYSCEAAAAKEVAGFQVTPPPPPSSGPQAAASTLVLSVSASSTAPLEIGGRKLASAQPSLSSAQLSLPGSAYTGGGVSATAAVMVGAAAQVSDAVERVGTDTAEGGGGGGAAIRLDSGAAATAAAVGSAAKMAGAAPAAISARPRMPYSMQRRLEWCRDVRDVRIHLTGVGGPSQGYEGSSSIQLSPPVFFGGYIWRLATRFVIAGTAAANAATAAATASPGVGAGGANLAVVPGLAALVAPGWLQLQLGVVCSVPVTGMGTAIPAAADSVCVTSGSGSTAGAGMPALWPAPRTNAGAGTALDSKPAALRIQDPLTLASCTLGVVDAAGKTAWQVVQNPCVLKPEEVTASGGGGGGGSGAGAWAGVSTWGRSVGSWEEGAADSWDLLQGQGGAGRWEYWSCLHGLEPTWWESGSALTAGGVLRLYGTLTLRC